MRAPRYSTIVAFVVLFGGLAWVGFLGQQSRTDVVSSRVRYPGEEAAAVRACQGQGQKVMYWWLEDPRKNSVTLHARCTGVVSVTAEVKL